ncbi:MAG TPA: PHP domain-containing protein [Vicinamibacterales bacterium]|nr:PHP domain-containing protein [Vicinamibacterales bacterium]
MIDLHTHTTASDGRCSPAELVARAVAAGVGVLSVTDHDTTAAAAASAAECAHAGVEFVPGIEITAVVDGLDVHVLGYFIDPDAAALSGFLTQQRERRVERVRQMVTRLAALGIELDVDAILRPSQSGQGRAVGRPWIARALVDGGHVATTAEAFEKYLKTGAPAFVPRVGPTPADVFAQIHHAEGVASLAHPGLLRRDDLIPGFVVSGLDAIEAHHSKHSLHDVERYLTIARDHRLAVSGGSDYHGDPSHDVGGVGSVALPIELFHDLKGRCATRRATATSLSPSTSTRSS